MENDKLKNVKDIYRKIIGKFFFFKNKDLSNYKQSGLRNEIIRNVVNVEDFQQWERKLF